MATSFSLEEALGQGAPAKTFSLEDALGVAPKPAPAPDRQPSLGSPMGDDFASQITSVAGTAPAGPGVIGSLSAFLKPEYKSAMERVPEEPRTGPGMMLRPEYVEEVRQGFAAIPVEKRRDALVAASQGTGATAQAAKRILAEVQAEDERQRELSFGRERMIDILAKAPKGEPAPRPFRLGQPPAAPVTFPEMAPTFAERMEGLPEEERIRQRLAKEEATRAVVSADTSLEAAAERAPEIWARQKADEWRTVGEWAADTLSAVGDTGISILSVPTNIIAPSSPLAAKLRDASESMRNLSSDVYKAERMVAKMNADQADTFAGKYAATLQSMIMDPGYSAIEAVKQAPFLFAVLGGARLGSALGGGTVSAAARVSPTLALGEAISGNALKAAAQASGAVAGGAATSVALTASDAAQSAYEKLTDPKQTPIEDWQANPDYRALRDAGKTHKQAVEEIATIKARLAALYAAPLGLAGFMGAEASMVSRGVAKGAQEAARKPAKTVAKEILGENIEEGGTSFAGNIAAKEIRRQQDLLEGVPEAMAAATVTSAPLAGIAGYQEYRAGREKAPVSEPVDQAARMLLDPQYRRAATMLPGEMAETRKPTEAPVPPPPAPPAPPAPPRRAAEAMREQQRAAEELEAEMEGRTPASFAADIAAGKDLTAPEDLQFYENNKDEVEAELRKLAPEGEDRGAETAETVEAKKERSEEPAAPEVKPEQPPILPKPEGFELKKGRNEQVVLAARELAAGRITKQEYDRYVDYYMPIEPVVGGKLEAPIEDDLMRTILTEKIKQKKDPKLVNAPIADGTRVGLRMDIPALDWGRANGVNGSVVSIHKGAAPDKTKGANLSYRSTGHIKNVVFAPRSEEKAFGIAQMREGKEGQKSPQQTMEGNWINTSPEETMRRVKALLDDPNWTQVSLDPLRHSYFYARDSRRPVLSADEALQVGRFVLVKNPVYGNREDFLYSIEPPKTESAAFKRWFGDSKIVDEDGNPLVVYHGTKREFNVFETKYPDGLFFFSTNPSFASKWPVGTGGKGDLREPPPGTEEEYNRIKKVEERLYSQYMKPSDDYDLNTKEGRDQFDSDRASLKAAVKKETGFSSAIEFEMNAGIRVMPVYLSIQKPFDPRKDFKKIEPFLAKAGKQNLIDAGYHKSGNWVIYEDKGVIDELKRQGYDGIWLAENIGGPHETIAAFSNKQIKSATGNRGTFEPTSPVITESVESEVGKPSIIIEPLAQEEKRSPSFKRTVKVLYKRLADGKISQEEFNRRFEDAVKRDEQARLEKEPQDRVRGADRIREVLLAAKRRGELSPETVELAEWFIKQNERLLDDLAISVAGRGERAVAGNYEAMTRLMTLIKDSAGEGTAVHEILHHLERMMPPEVQRAIRKEWLGSLLKASREAKTPAERLYYTALLDFNFRDGKVDLNTLPADLRPLYYKTLSQMDVEGDTVSGRDLAMQLLKNGDVNISHYQHFNPSEFWAINGTEIVQGRYNAIKGGVLARLKNWLKELGEKIKSIFGYRSNAPLIRALDSLAKADGKFVSKEMLGQGDFFMEIAPEEAPSEERRPTTAIGKNIYNRRPTVAWTEPDATKLDDFIYRLQDKQIDTKRVVQEIEKAVGRLDDRWNPYLQEELYHGRTATATKDFLRSEVRPLLEEMKKEGVSIGELETYLHNRFAPTRNANIAKINPAFPDDGSPGSGGSGIDTQDAEAYMASLTPEEKAKFERLASRVYGITQGTRDYLVGSGLEDQDTISAWEKSSPDYVPLNREDIEYSTSVGTGTGQGYSVRGPSTRRAMGSLRGVADILANVIMQRERAIVRGEKNRVAVALYGLAAQNPNPGFWLAVNPDAKGNKTKAVNELIDMGLTKEDAEGLMQEPAQRIIDPQTGLVAKRINPVLRGANNVLAARINGKDRFVFFNTKDPRAERMVTALKNLDADQLGRLMTTMAAITRYFSQINTQYNPVFGIYNFLRDLQGGAIQLSGTPLEDSRAEVLSPKNLAGALNGIYSTLRAERKNQPQLMTPWSELWIDFQREGGQTGYRDMFSRAQERADALEAELKRLQESGGKKAVFAVPRAILDWLTDYNETLENAVRLTAYKAALDKGLSKEQAASIAKNLTVNFNRKGQIATQAGALYSFFNSSVQGTSRLLGTVTKMEKPGDIKSLRLSSIGKKIVYGGLLLGSIQAMMLAAFGFDDNEPPDFVKDRNLILPLPDGKYLAWPVALGYNVIPSVGRIITEWGISGFKDTPKRLTHLLSLLMEAFSPVGNAGLSVQTIAPTLFDPLVALAENKDWTGKKIAKEDFNKLDPTPGYTRAKESASWLGKQFAYYLNMISGGDKDKPGVVSPTPDQIDYLIGQATGGVGREVLKATKTAEAAVTGEELPPYNIPLVGRFYGNTKAGYAESQRFYKNLEELNVLQNQLEGRTKRKENPQEFLKENPKVRLADAAHQVERNIRTIRKQRDELIAKGAPREQVKAKENQMTLQMKKLNDAVAKAEKKKD